MRTAALFITMAVAMASAAREERNFATTEIMKYWVKTDLYCYVTEKSGILGLKKLKECESSSGRHKRSVIIDDRIEQDEDEFIMQKFIKPTPPVIEVEKEQGLETSENLNRSPKFFNKYIITFTSKVYLTKYTGTTSIKFKCTPRYDFIPHCEDSKKDKFFSFNKNKGSNSNSYDDSHGGYDDHDSGYGGGGHYNEGSYGSGSNNNKGGGFGFFGDIFGRKK